MSPLPTTKPKVLIIDDLTEMRNLLASALEDFCEVRCVDNGAYGVTAAQQWQPALIVCDVLMPGLNGFQTVQRLREDESTAKIPVLVLTGVAEDVEDFPGFAEMVSGIIPKPFGAVRLREAVRAALAAAA